MANPSVSFAIHSHTWKHQDAEFTSLLAITIGLTLCIHKVVLSKDYHIKIKRRWSLEKCKGVPM